MFALVFKITGKARLMAAEFGDYTITSSLPVFLKNSSRCLVLKFLISILFYHIFAEAHWLFKFWLFLLWKLLHFCVVLLLFSIYLSLFLCMENHICWRLDYIQIITMHVIDIRSATPFFIWIFLYSNI